MKTNYIRKNVLTAWLLLASFTFAAAQKSSQPPLPIEEKNVRAEIEFLASDALQGRGSGTMFELLAGQYIASQLRQFGVEAAGEKDASGNPTYIQTVNITRASFSQPIQMSYQANGAKTTLEHGKEMLVARINAAQISGNLQKLKADEKAQNGSIVFVRFPESETPQTVNQKIQQFASAGAKAVIVEELPVWRNQWAKIAARPISFTSIGGVASNNPNLIIISKDAAAALEKTADGANIEIRGELASPKTQRTYNAVGKIEGSDKTLAAEVILLSAHMDHLGVREDAPGDDKIFNGADDDASGCVAVLELARSLSNGQRPRRTVYFTFFGSEEAGGYGAQYFVNNLPFAKDKLVANLEFEMIGRPDQKVAADELWLTGYERSNLGSELAKQGAKLVADPHPEENFFQRSDNYTLARQGVIAHTVSSFNLHADYHHASDEIKTIDFSHMTRAISSMVKPVEWLVNSNFKPVWFEGKKP